MLRKLMSIGLDIFYVGAFFFMVLVATGHIQTRTIVITCDTECECGAKYHGG